MTSPFGSSIHPTCLRTTVGGLLRRGNVILILVGPHRGEVWELDTVDPRPEGSNPRVEWFDRRDVTKVADWFRELMAGLMPLDAYPDRVHQSTRRGAAAAARPSWIAVEFDRHQRRARARPGLGHQSRSTER
jgi:hypothetical protein